MKELLKSIKEGLQGIWYGLFYEKTPEGNKKFSLGRLLLMVLFGMSLVLWGGDKEIPQTMLTVLLTFVGYNFGTKAVSVIEKLVTKK